jgi:hypothetical protein
VRARRSTAKITTDKGLTMPNRASRMRTACLAVLLLAAALPGAARPADDAPAADRATLTVADFDLAAPARYRCRGFRAWPPNIPKTWWSWP